MCNVRRKKKWVALGLCLCLAAGIFSGCGTKEEDGTSPGASPGASQEAGRNRGRYVGTDTDLSDLEVDRTIKQIFRADDKIHLLTAQEENGITHLREWEQQEEQFADVTQGWMENLELPCETWADMKLMLGGDGVQYLYVRLFNESSFEGHLWKGKGSEAEEITPEEWTVLDETWGIYEYIVGIDMVGDSTLAAVTNTSVELIVGEDGSMLASESVTSGYGETVFSDGKNLYLLAIGSSGNVDAIEKRPGGSGENAEKITMPISSLGSASLCAEEDGTLIAAGGEGIFRYNIVSESWEKLLDGTETDFALATRWCIGLTSLGDGSIYALFRHENGGISLTRYAYDPDAVTEVTEELKLYTLWESPLLQQAAVMYHREHPEVLISIEYVYEQYSRETPDYNQIYQTLNTMLMGDDAPDILVLDHLNMEPYAEKGLLVDLSGAVDELESAGELLSNITGAYVREDGSRYAVPLQFGFTMALGRGISAENMVSLETLAKFLPTELESIMGTLTVDELVDRFYPYFCGEIVKGDQLDRETLAQNLEWLKIIADNSGIVGSHEEEGRRSMWLLPSQVRLAFEQVDGFWDCMTPIAIKEYVQEGSFAAYENCFTPHLQTGINSKSAYQETALDFLRFALSESAQNTEFYSGFPVNLAALEALAATDRSDVAMATSITAADGSEEMFEIPAFSEETAVELVRVCKALNRPVVEDEKIREELIAALPGFLDGSRSLEETLDSIEGALRMYLAE